MIRDITQDEKSFMQPLTAEEMRIAAAGVVSLPIEQAAPWEEFERSQGRSLWGRLAWIDKDGRTSALVALYEYSLRGSKYLWARHGPIWLREQSPEREKALRSDLRAYVRSHDKSVVFVRLHAAFYASDLQEPLQIITYDRTVIIDTSGGTQESILQSMTSDGRRAIRRANKKMLSGGGAVVEETGLSEEQFGEYYAIMCETAKRDGFHPHPQSVYWNMLSSLGPTTARLFGVRIMTECENAQESEHDERASSASGQGELVCWDLVLVHDRQAVAYYGASNSVARTVLGPDALDFEVSAILAAEGVQGLDLMGTSSPRIPQLYSVGRYKRRWAQSYTDVDGAWDYPIKSKAYAVLRMALRLKRRLTSRR